jgi:hypothetical protein
LDLHPRSEVEGESQAASIFPSADLVLGRRLRSELAPPVGAVAVGVGISAAGASVGAGVATVVSTGEGNGVGVAVSAGVAAGVAEAAVGAGVVIGVEAASTAVASGSGACAGDAAPSTAAYIAATAMAMAKTRRVTRCARARAGRRGRWPSTRGGGVELDPQRIDRVAQCLELARWVPDPTCLISTSSED